MRGVRAALTVLAFWLGAGLPARAGVYHSGPQVGLPPPNQLRLILGQVRAVRSVRGGPPALPGSLREKYEQRAAVLEAQEKAGWLPTLDRIDLGACYIRLGRDQDAIRVLEAGDRKHFQVLANLATAYHGIGQLDRAIAYQRQALDAWPAVWAGWTEEQSQRYRRADRYYYSLLQLRNREQLRARGRPARVTTVDDLFPKVRFVGPSGHYEAGGFAQASRDEVPEDAILVVLQLVVWLPFDDRLYWLLGELFNASGKVQTAYDVFDELVYARRMDARELAQHRQALRDAVLAYRAWLEPGTHLSLLWALSPPAAGGLSQAAAPWAAQFKPELAAGPAFGPGGNGPAQTSPPPPPNWLPDWRPLAVGFGAGAVVALLSALQWREWRRRRPAPLPAEEHAAANGGIAPPGASEGLREARPGERGASAP